MRVKITSYNRLMKIIFTIKELHDICGTTSPVQAYQAETKSRAPPFEWSKTHYDSK